MLIYAEYFLRKGQLRYTVMVIKPCLSAPADVQCALHVRFAPLHHPAQLLPVIDLLKGHLLHRSAGYDKSVVIFILYVIKGFVKGYHVLPGGMLGHSAADGDKLHVDLQRGIAQQTCKLRFGSNFGGHQIQNKNAQRTDILSCRALVVHNKNIFICQNPDSRQIAGDPYWHLYTCFY